MPRTPPAQPRVSLPHIYRGLLLLPSQVYHTCIFLLSAASSILRIMGSFSSVHFTIFCLNTKPCPSFTLPAISHFCAPFSQENCLKTIVYPLAYTSSCSTHSLTLSSWTCPPETALAKVIGDFHIVKNMPILVLLVFKWQLAGLTSSSSLKHCFTVGFYNITLRCLWKYPT